MSWRCYGNKLLFWMTTNERLIYFDMTFAGSCCTAAPEPLGGRDQRHTNSLYRHNATLKNDWYPLLRRQNVNLILDLNK